MNKPGVNLRLLLQFQVSDRDIGDQHVGFTIFKRARQFSVEQLELSVIGIPLNLDQNHKTLLKQKVLKTLVGSEDFVVYHRHVIMPMKRILIEWSSYVKRTARRT